ncbi:sulfide:quinone oxidoreductase [Kribbella orskensis]|uniref:Sulfide:quinone oxidoreductase n=1 Tax=Kribbella orskensis TaxID=2512216 RepID=A0ABY2B621_9ACTN|nr:MULTISPECIES: FAD-dependent oxidoreductase [Kribbella]TCN28325.1 sulfide:quinone oxidoreductase [Kribbella sp. VKM Ac-2500]TCO08188.1 sulfide:quinone oxidoreductase [Kribbella orskensis]
MRKKVLVLGANFGGLTAALAVRHELDGDVDVTVVSASDQFLFNPSLIWLPFGKRDSADITFPVAPTLDSRGIEFVHAAATKVDPVAKKVTADDGREFGYDYLVIATGYRNKDDVVPGFKENANTITTLPEAQRTAVAWRRFLDDPGDVVVAATQGAGCFGAAYEFLFNTAHQLRKAGLHNQVKLTYVTAEPFLGHFGIGGLPHGEQLLGMFLKKEGIDTRISVGIDHIDQGALVLADGENLPFRFSMVIPPFLGQQFLNESNGLVDEKGYVVVRDTYQSEKYDDVYAVGVAAAVDAPWQTPTPVGIPKTGFPTEVMAHTAAANIAAQIRGEKPTNTKAFGDIKAVCVMDAGNNGVIILADKMLPPRKHGVLIPGPQAHLMKLGFEKYFLWKMRHGYVQLP